VLQAVQLFASQDIPDRPFAPGQRLSLDLFALSGCPVEEEAHRADIRVDRVLG
jgi:hypothetical protein